MTQRSLEPHPVTARAQRWVSSLATIRDGVMPPTSGAAAYRLPGGHPTLFAAIVRLLPRLILIVAIGLLLATLAIFAFRAVFDDRIYPAVVVGDVAVGGMTVDQASAAVERRAAALEQRTITFTWQGQTWTPTLAELGATVDVDTSVDEAHALGRDDNAVSRLGFTHALLRDDQVVPLRTTVDHGTLEQWFASVDADIDQGAVDANIVIDGTTVTVNPEQTGTMVDRDAATAVILRSIASLEPGSVALPTMVDRPAVTADDLKQPAASLQASLSAPVVVTFDGKKWDLAPADLVSFVRVEVATEGEHPDIAVSLDRGALATWLREGFSSEVNRPPVDARVAWDAEEGLVALDPSQDGAALRANAFADGVSGSFFDRQGPVEIPVITTKPAIDGNNLGALNINARLSRGDSNYGGQRWARDTNVEVATKLLNGTLVAPGEEFSFNGAIGEITKDKGYVESGVIVNGRASTDDGGGVCQVSTTVFRATIFAGLPITDWAEHTQRLGIYEQDGWTAGYDASILQWVGGDPAEWGDFKFVNDTGGYILVQSWTQYPYVIVEIYGNDDGRQVDISDAQVWEASSYPDDIEVIDDSLPAGSMWQSEWPRIPAEAVFTMTVTYADGSVNEQEFYSEYHGSGEVWTVSPDMAGQSPGA
jgi:vancomycin resistance protein YoaR